MTFAQIQGGEQIVRALTGMIDSGKVPHALMFHEDDGGGAVSLAVAFLQYLMCRNRLVQDSCSECPSCNKLSKLIHPDVHFIYPVMSGTSVSDYAAKWRSLVSEEPSFTVNRMQEVLGMEGKSPLISVPVVKELLDKLSLSALEGGYRCVVMYLPELMSAESGNRLLKLIEEPPAKTQFILITHNPDKVLVTIRSRCQCLRVLPLGFASASQSPASEADTQNESLFEELMAALLGKDFKALLEVGENLAGISSRERQKAFCIFASECFRRIFLVQQKMDTLAKIPPHQIDRYSAWAAGCKKSFPRCGFDSLSRALRLLERNVSAKIVFAELACRLFKAL